ncbi:MAG: DUF4286 family protein [Archangium sp.]|nr:DUF4286 family protein [Archangium sp.]MDP3151231.1 DUF4286 family protein [Archangium sp.]MDP3570128.1 DUF4286 family protein [Archangium sp.]
MMTFEYTVTAEFDHAAVAAEWAAWLRDGHLQEVLDGGAREAVLVQLAPLRFQARYAFADAAAFAKYEQESAPKLRAEGLAKFPPSRGVSMSRSTGEVHARLSR